VPFDAHRHVRALLELIGRRVEHHRRRSVDLCAVEREVHAAEHDAAAVVHHGRRGRSRGAGAARRRGRRAVEAAKDRNTSERSTAPAQPAANETSKASIIRRSASIRPPLARAAAPHPRACQSAADYTRPTLHQTDRRDSRARCGLKPASGWIPRSSTASQTLGVSDKHTFPTCAWSMMAGARPLAWNARASRGSRPLLGLQLDPAVERSTLVRVITGNRLRLP
jgi:hypothetical protein